jgi:hypothetical protein
VVSQAARADELRQVEESAASEHDEDIVRNAFAGDVFAWF